MERKRLDKGRSQPGDSRERAKSGHRKNVTGRRALTIWWWQWECQVRARKEGDQARRTHKLETAEGRPKIRTQKVTELGALTTWTSQGKRQLRTRRGSD